MSGTTMIAVEDGMTIIDMVLIVMGLGAVSICSALFIVAISVLVRSVSDCFDSLAGNDTRG